MLFYVMDVVYLETVFLHIDRKQFMKIGYEVQ
jgi:hypothetical protein